MLQGTLKDFLNSMKRMWVVFIVRIIHSLHHIMSHQSHAHTQCEHELTTAHTAAADLLYACAFAMERIISGCINTRDAHQEMFEQENQLWKNFFRKHTQTAQFFQWDSETPNRLW